MEFTERLQSFQGPMPRLEIEKMNAYKAPLEGRRHLLRLDFNENTIGPSSLVIEAIRNLQPDHISIYPEYNGLREALVANLKTAKLSTNVTAEQIGLFNGVDAAINAIFHAYGDSGDQLITTTPTFGYYEPCAHMQGMLILAFPYEGESFQFPLEKIQTALLKQQPKILIICNPNNPTGTRLEANKILKLASTAPNTLIVIDELYEAFTGDSVLPKVNFTQTPNLVVLRSLSKTAGLAGLRIGFAIGNSHVVDRISRVTGPYDVNSIAVTASLAALTDQAYIDFYVEEVLKARDWIKHKLIKSGRRYHIDGGNYLLIWPKHEVSKIELSLRAAGILVRNMKSKPLIEGSLRVSIGTTSQMAQFWAAFSEIDGIEA